MIDARELRIGNWIKTISAEHWIDKVVALPSIWYKSVVKGETYYKTGVSTNRITIDEDRCYPIPLTPELLEKCGFKQNYFYWEEKNMSLTQDLDGFHFIVHNEYEEGIPIIHLHQLQNLYYSLTGKELKVDL